MIVETTVSAGSRPWRRSSGARVASLMVVLALNVAGGVAHRVGGAEWRFTDLGDLGGDVSFHRRCGRALSGRGHLAVETGASGPAVAAWTVAWALHLSRFGDFAVRLQAYGRGGQPCARCGAVLRDSRLSGRSTVWCAGCQR